MSIFVVGGNGFVGQHICKKAVDTGLHVVSLSRSGAPEGHQPWHSNVTWVQGNASDLQNFKDHLANVDLLVSCIGAIGWEQQSMRHVNGEVNLQMLKTVLDMDAKSRPAVAFISATHAPGAPKWFLQGYFEGKQMMEEALRTKMPDQHLILEPGIIYGWRYVKPLGFRFPLPLHWLGRPLRAILAPLSSTLGLEKIPLLGIVMTPPTDVQDIANVVVEATRQQREFSRESSAELSGEPSARLASGVTLSSVDISKLGAILRKA